MLLPTISFRTPVNLFNDKTRYRLLIIFHLIDFFTFFTRFTILCAEDLVKISKLDLNHSYRQSLSYIIPILIFELFSSLISIFSRFLYLITKCCLKTLYNGDDTSNYAFCCKRNTLWHLSTLTCFNLKCYSEHSQGYLLTRLATLVICFFFRLLSFLLGASCSNRYLPRAVIYYNN
ncbi:unnamed protein product [Didymodactylos carnosus]|uniref:Uncharacterized protein n=1 Tax=Didymodactylos carnosus TaxID=1234261 RepID=A0A814I2B6_9BILA|nr:unnamed protein product [Didymodactylos carnosus]CAF3789325.1 unnamed protein product [Didymodactylos carnosus]